MASNLAPGLYERLITEALAQTLKSLDPELVTQQGLDAGDAHVLLARHIFQEVERSLADIKTDAPRQLELVNRVLAVVREYAKSDTGGGEVRAPAEALRGIAAADARISGKAYLPPRPSIPLGASDLLVNAKNEPRVGHAIMGEVGSADRIDLLCAFIRWHGVALLSDILREHLVERARPMRILTTTYMGATERRAIDELARMGAEIRICYETQSTRLHAKAWLLYRQTGFSTAFIGSSNISHSALMDGIEWNVRLSQVETPDILEKFGATFETYWEDKLFKPYDPERPEDVEKLDRALDLTRGTEATEIAYIDIEPYDYQAEILETLHVERERHGRFRNLVVSATGTGKTMIAAFDFARWYAENPQATLLFVAHREDILTQSLNTFRTVLRDGSFGELLVGGHKPQKWKHVFASIQSLTRQSDELSADPIFAADAFDFVIIDEFHHAAARTYSELLEHLEPQILLGLTATPERTDGQSILNWFGGRIAAEMRLWEALDRQLLAPFQYFGVHDNTKLNRLKWTLGKYNARELGNLYTADHGRVALILRAIQAWVLDAHKMKALGFCVNIEHAEFMAAEFNRAGISALALTSNSPADDRHSAKHRLTSGELQVIFTVDLFNEGVDIPEVDTVLFLRPTESATVFLQQLGRGLRKAPKKSCLTVLDFIGHAHKNFRYDIRYQALSGVARGELAAEIEEGFGHLPAGCSIQLDRVASKLVLENIKRSVGGSVTAVASELAEFGDISLAEFLARTQREPEDIYKTSNWYWTKIRRQAGLATLAEGPGEARFGGCLSRLLHIDAADRLGFYDRLLRAPKPPGVGELSPAEERMLYMLHFALWGDSSKNREQWANAEALLKNMWQHPAVMQELRQLLALLNDRATHVTFALDQEMGWEHQVPLSVHARYTLSEIRAAFGLLSSQNSTPIREGVRYLDAYSTDLFFITLEKTEKHYSPQTMYKDYAMSSRLFHWESQSTTSATTPTGQRYIHHRQEGTNVLLFVRRHRKINGRTQPYTLLGPANYVRHEGDRPMGIVWELQRAMPSDLFLASKVLAG